MILQSTVSLEILVLLHSLRNSLKRKCSHNAVNCFFLMFLLCFNRRSPKQNRTIRDELKSWFNDKCCVICFPSVLIWCSYGAAITRAVNARRCRARNRNQHLWQTCRSLRIYCFSYRSFKKLVFMKWQSNPGAITMGARDESALLENVLWWTGGPITRFGVTLGWNLWGMLAPSCWIYVKKRQVWCKRGSSWHAGGVHK